MAEEQLEIEIQGCKRCGADKEFESSKYCRSCERLYDQALIEFDTLQRVISKVIYDVSKTDLKLLHEIIFGLAKQDFLKEFEINQSRFAEKLGWHQANVSRSLKKLVNAKLLIKNENLYSIGGISEITYFRNGEKNTKN
jgi:predicted transcriptional regulator